MGDKDQEHAWLSLWSRLKDEMDVSGEPDGNRPDFSIDPASINAVSGQFLTIRESANAEMFVACILWLILALFCAKYNANLTRFCPESLKTVPNTLGL